MSDLNKQIVDVIQSQLPAQTAGVLKAYLEETSSSLKELKACKEALKEKTEELRDSQRENDKISKALAIFKNREQLLESAEFDVRERERKLDVAMLNLQVQEANNRAKICFDLVDRVFKNPTYVKQTIGDIPMLCKNESNGYSNSHMTTTRADVTHKETIE
jgi:hypothetical protein